jgi:GNAT superfamily N-acetyltransferase
MTEDNTIVRPLEFKDCLEAMKMGHELHDMSSIADIPFNEEKVRNLFARALTSTNRNLCLVAERSGELIGSFYGVIVPYYFSDELIAQEYWVYVRDGHRGTHAGTSFVKRFYDWASAHGVREVMIAPSTGIQTKRTEAWLNNIGYETMGVMTKRRVA